MEESAHQEPHTVKYDGERIRHGNVLIDVYRPGVRVRGIPASRRLQQRYPELHARLLELEPASALSIGMLHVDRDGSSSMQRLNEGLTPTAAVAALLQDVRNSFRTIVAAFDGRLPFDILVGVTAIAPVFERLGFEVVPSDVDQEGRLSESQKLRLRSLKAQGVDPIVARAAAEHRPDLIVVLPKAKLVDLFGAA